MDELGAGPRTEAGRALLERIQSLNGRSFPLATAEDMAKVEAEARRAGLGELRDEILTAGMFEGCGGMGCTEERNDELALILTAISRLSA